MEISTIKTLAESSPRIAFSNARDCNARIRELETNLGHAPSKPIWNIRLANRRLAELESIVAERGKIATLAHASNGAAPIEEAAPAQSIGLTGRDRFAAAHARSVAKKPKLASHPELHGADRFAANIRINGAPQKLSGNQNTGKTGRERFKSAITPNFITK